MNTTKPLTAAQQRALAILHMPSLESKFHGYAVTGLYTSKIEYYQGKYAHHFQNHPQIHAGTARALANMGLAIVEHDLGLQQFTVRPVKQAPQP